MKFIDSLVLELYAGDGGDGCMSFRREKFVPRGGPDGGNGGNGGDIIFVGDNSKHTLLDLSYNKIYRGKRGEHGRGKDMHGRGGEVARLKVPIGTIVKDFETGEIIADITECGQEYVICKGGRGGRGNAMFVSSTQRAPRRADPGDAGDARKVALELKLIADVGIIGMPNAGKSTFISTVSAARPKVADYPFTTLTPNLGVVKNIYGEPYVLADMPGLIEGAHKGVGLGIRFLRHIERTKVLVHFVDSSGEESMVERYKSIRIELEKYGENVADKAEIVVATKLDSAWTEHLDEFKEYMAAEHPDKELHLISSVVKEGLDGLLKSISDAVDSVNMDDFKDFDDDLDDDFEDSEEE